MNVDFYSYTNKGSRPINEDSYIINPNNGTAILCDGLGGQNSGEVASKIAAECVIRTLDSVADINDVAIVNAIGLANRKILTKQREAPECFGMSTTLVGCAEGSGGLYYFNVGDSRFYYFHNDIIQLMTKDQSVSQMSVDLGDMSFDDIRFDSDRNKLLKSLGKESAANSVAIYEPIQISEGDAFLLCSDGFWEYVYEDEMEADLSKSKTAEEWLKYMLVRLMLRVKSNNDNFTAVCGIIKRPQI